MGVPVLLSRPFHPIPCTWYPKKAEQQNPSGIRATGQSIKSDNDPNFQISDRPNTFFVRITWLKNKYECGLTIA
jgi:hypothetical protein